MKNLYYGLILIFLTACGNGSGPEGQPAPISGSGTIDSVIDGDTVALFFYSLDSCIEKYGEDYSYHPDLTVEEKRACIRTVYFYGVDAPEKSNPFNPPEKQPYSEESTEALAQKILGKAIIFEGVKRDSLGRNVGRIYYDGKDIGLEMICEGHAWWDHYRAPNEPDYSHCQNNAEANQIGLFALPGYMHPMEFRIKDKY